MPKPDICFHILTILKSLIPNIIMIMMQYLEYIPECIIINIANIYSYMMISYHKDLMPHAAIIMPICDIAYILLTLERLVNNMTSKYIALSFIYDRL